MTVIATVWCGYCYDEGRDHPGRLGEVRAAGMLGRTFGYGDGFVRWEAYDPRLTRKVRHLRFRSGVVLVNPKFTGTWPVPEHLDVWCKHHGPGRVLTSDVINDRGNVVRHMIRTATA